MSDGVEVAAPTPDTGLRWWREVAYSLAFYLVYSFIRNRFGSAAVSPDTAKDNADHVIAVERALGSYHEETIQRWFLANDLFIRFWNIFYGTAHFVVTAFALVFLFRRFPQDYRRWRNTLAFTTALALIGFSLFPLMPPRLLGDCGQYGACIESGYVDTLAEIGGLWSFDSDAMESVSNQYAAMPSLHFAWSFWCFLVLYSRIRNRVGKVLIAIYPWATVFSIVVTANHFWIDALGGAVVLGVGYVLGAWLADVTERRRAARLAASGGVP